MNRFTKTDFTNKTEFIIKKIERINYYKASFFDNWSVYINECGYYAMVHNDTKQMLFLGKAA